MPAVPIRHQIIKKIHEIFLFFICKNLFYHHKIYFIDKKIINLEDISGFDLWESLVLSDYSGYERIITCRYSPSRLHTFFMHQHLCAR